MDITKISKLHDPILNPPSKSKQIVMATNSDLEAEAHEIRVQKEKTSQFKRLKDDAHAILGQVRGLPGIRSSEQWAEMLEKAGDDIGNGRFIVRQLGAERYLDSETVAVLITLRQNLLSEIPNPSTADVMMVDAAVIGYYNMLRTQGWIGNLSLVVERELFGQAPLNEIHGQIAGQEIEKHLRRLAETMLPLQDRAHKMMARSLATVSAINYRRKK